MKNLLFIFISFLVFQTQAQNDFRKMNWGDTPSQLKEAYPEVIWYSEKTENSVTYITDDIIGGLESKVAFIFIDNELHQGIYMFTEDHNSNNLYYDDFVTISNLLNKKYEMERTENWIDNTWKDEPNYIGYALSKGDVEIVELHEGQRTMILHKINGDVSINHILSYASREFVDKLRSVSLDDF